MTPEEWHRVRPILESALELDSANRRAFLSEACADPSLRREVESLIDAHEQADTWVLNSLSVSGLGVEEGARFRLLPGKRVGPYEILEELALGGMGAVYRAVRADGEYKQQVALKIVRADNSDRDIGPSLFCNFSEKRGAASASEASVIGPTCSGMTIS